MTGAIKRKKTPKSRLSLGILVLLFMAVVRLFTSFDPIGETITRLMSPLSKYTRSLNLNSNYNQLNSEESEQLVRAYQQEKVMHLEGLLSGSSSNIVSAKVYRYDVSSVRKHLWLSLEQDFTPRLDSPVFNDGFLVGVVDKVSSSQARVQLVVDPQFAITARAGSNHGLASSETGSLLFAQTDGEGLMGSFVVTDGLGGRLPPGVPVGRLGDEVSDPAEVFRKYKLELMQSIYTLEYVQMSVRDGV